MPRMILTDFQSLRPLVVEFEPDAEISVSECFDHSTCVIISSTRAEQTYFVVESKFHVEELWRIAR